jgi:hypothetical protein
MATGPVITDENNVRSMAKLTTLGKALPGALMGIGTEKPRRYRPPVPPAVAFPRSNTIKVLKGPTLKREQFVAKQSRHPPDPSARLHHTEGDPSP